MQRYADPLSGFWTAVRRLSIASLAVSFVLCASPAMGQNDSGGLSQQGPAPVTITPAPTNTSGNTPVVPIFPQSTTGGNGPSLVTRPSMSASPNGPSSGAGLGYGPIRPGDIVEVQIFDAPEYSVKMPVSPAGLIAIPYAGLFHIEGMTSIEAAKAIAQLFEDKEILRDPRVLVTTQQFGYSVTVMGEVKSPGIYTLAGRKRLIDLLTEAGGVTNAAGHLIEIFSPGSMKNPTTV